MKHPSSRTLSVLLVTIVFLSASLFPVRQARAAAGAEDILRACLVAAGAGLVANQISTAILAIFHTAQVAQQVRSVPVGNILLELSSEQNWIFNAVIKGFQDCLVYGAGQLALNYLNDSSLYWVKNGFGGAPLFAVSLDRFYLDTSGIIAGGLSTQLQRNIPINFYPGFITSLSNSVQLSTRQNADRKFIEQLRSPYPAGVDPVRFQDDFNQGGWEAYYASLQDAGNPIGVTLASRAELELRQEEARKLGEQRLNFSSGFQDVPDTGKCDYPEGVKERVESEGGPDDPVRFTDQELAMAQRMYCKTTTPGKVVETKTTKTTNTDTDRFGFIDTLSKLVNVFMIKMTQRAIEGIF